MSSSEKLLTVIVLTRDEAIHLPRLFLSFAAVPSEFVVVDSGSHDRTCEISREFGARVVSRIFDNHAAQFNWALDNVPIGTSWVMRMDADEYLTPALAQELPRMLKEAPPHVTGWLVKRRVIFWGRWIRHGGYYPTWLLRIWRTGAARIESRYMDEHVVLMEGETRQMLNDIVDENRKGLTDWTAKHNRYSDQEIRDLIETREGGDIESLTKHALRRRRLKFSVYARTPLFLRAFLYWLYRYFIRVGFLDGRPGLVFHFLQGFWYRFLIDAKLYEYRLRSVENETCVIADHDGGIAPQDGP